MTKEEQEKERKIRMGIMRPIQGRETNNGVHFFYLRVACCVSSSSEPFIGLKMKIILIMYYTSSRVEIVRGIYSHSRKNMQKQNATTIINTNKRSHNHTHKQTQPQSQTQTQPQSQTQTQPQAQTQANAARATHARKRNRNHKHTRRSNNINVRFSNSSSLASSPEMAASRKRK